MVILRKKMLTSALKVVLELIIISLFIVIIAYSQTEEERLIQILKYSDCRNGAMETLIKIGPPAVPFLIAAINDKDREVQKRAVEILGIIKDPRAVKPLIIAMQDYRLGKAASLSLTKIGLPAIEPLFAFVEGNLHNFKQMSPVLFATGTLGAIRKDPLAANIMADYVKHKNLKYFAENHGLIIELGLQGSEISLVKALNLYGEKIMAQNFINSGNKLLAEAGEKWASSHGYSVFMRSGIGAPKWPN
jgi:hypothetical protein